MISYCQLLLLYKLNFPLIHYYNYIYPICNTIVITIFCLFVVKCCFQWAILGVLMTVYWLRRIGHAYVLLSMCVNKLHRIIIIIIIIISLFTQNNTDNAVL